MWRGAVTQKPGNIVVYTDTTSLKLLLRFERREIWKKVLRVDKN